MIFWYFTLRFSLTVLLLFLLLHISFMSVLE